MASLFLIGVFGLSGKKQAERLEAILVESFRSPLALEVKRTEQKVIRLAAEQPQEAVTLLLRHYDHEDNRVRRAAQRCLTEISKNKPGMEAILADMVHPSRNIRKAVQSFLGDSVGAHAVTFASFYEQTMLLVAMSKRKDIPVDDILSLADLSKQTFMEGEVMEAVRDIGFCLDYIKHRYRNSEQLKEYVSELLKMAPDLSRMGVYSSAIEEPLRKAMKASINRSYDETREIIEERVRKSSLRNALHKMGKVVKENIHRRPRMEPCDLTDEDLSALSRLHELVDSITSLILVRETSEATTLLLAFVEDDFIKVYDRRWEERVSMRESAALFTVYTISIVCVKLASSLISATAEDVYQQNYRHLEEEPSIHVVMWPDAVMRIITDDPDGHQAHVPERTASSS